MKPRYQNLRLLAGSTLATVVVLSFAAVAPVHAALWTGGAADNNWDNLGNWAANPTGGVGEVNTTTAYPIVTVANTLVPNDLKIATANPNSTGQVDIRSGIFTINYWAFVGDWAGDVHAIDAASGDITWSTKIGSQIMSSVTVDGDDLYVALPGSGVIADHASTSSAAKYDPIITR